MMDVACREQADTSCRWEMRGNQCVVWGDTSCKYFSARVTLEEYSNPSTDDIRFIKYIYEANFPANEKAPFDKLTQIMTTPPNKILLARESHTNDIIGVMWLQQLGNSCYMYMPYFAVDRIFQSKGVGTMMLQFARDLLTASGVEGLVWEIDAPDGISYSKSMRRLAFYEGCGARVLDYSHHYEAPSMTNPRKGIPMWLMMLPMKGMPFTNDLRTACNCANAILTHFFGYNNRRHRDRVLHQMMLYTRV